uniref:BPTI/Kunitz inhibitor domain-containing protein n=1 Tax=Meloidogyne incognita TaxID=6306 RepID=A0A914N9X6_MELIC
MRDCRKHYDKGYDCGEGLEIDNSGIKWYYDHELEMCLSFVYKGCGENKNGFNSKDDANGVFQVNLTRPLLI